jgi:hypothetical protein
MTNDRRLMLLKVGAAVVVGLLVADRVVFTPLIAGWKKQGERIVELRKMVNEGRQVLSRQSAIQGRWDAMVKGDLVPDVAEAENDMVKAMARWARNSRVTFTGLNPQWRPQEGYETLECRASASGEQLAIARFLQELEKDPLAVRLEACEISAKDSQGRQLTLSARFSAVRIQDDGGPAR